MKEHSLELFPPDATDAERTTNWPKIVEISDQDFGFNTSQEKTNVIRFCVRILLFNRQNEICVVKSEKYTYLHQLQLFVMKCWIIVTS